MGRINKVEAFYAAKSPQPKIPAVVSAVELEVRRIIGRSDARSEANLPLSKGGRKCNRHRGLSGRPQAGFPKTGLDSTRLERAAWARAADDDAFAGFIQPPSSYDPKTNSSTVTN